MTARPTASADGRRAPRRQHDQATDGGRPGGDEDGVGPRRPLPPRQHLDAEAAHRRAHGEAAEPGRRRTCAPAPPAGDEEEHHHEGDLGQDRPEQAAHRAGGDRVVVVRGVVGDRPGRPGRLVRRGTDHRVGHGHAQDGQDRRRQVAQLHVRGPGRRRPESDVVPARSVDGQHVQVHPADVAVAGPGQDDGRPRRDGGQPAGDGRVDGCRHAFPHVAVAVVERVVDDGHHVRPRQRLRQRAGAHVDLTGVVGDERDRFRSAPRQWSARRRAGRCRTRRRGPRTCCPAPRHGCSPAASPRARTRQRRRWRWRACRRRRSRCRPGSGACRTPSSPTARRPRSRPPADGPPASPPGRPSAGRGRR